MALFLYLFVAAMALVYYFVKRRYNYWSCKGFASPPSAFLFGSLKGVGTKVTSAERMNEIYKEYKGKVPAVGTYFFLKPTLLPIDPEVLKNILVRDFSSFQNRGFYYNKEDDPTSAKYFFSLQPHLIIFT